MKSCSSNWYEGGAVCVCVWRGGGGDIFNIRYSAVQVACS